MKCPHYKSEREFIVALQEYEYGMISAWKHIGFIIKSCIKEHRKLLRKERLVKLVKMNTHLIESFKK